VNIVPAIGQLNAKLGGYYAAAAISRITGYTDPHRSPCVKKKGWPAFAISKQMRG
jgi:hypothetical protein